MASDLIGRASTMGGKLSSKWQSAGMSNLTFLHLNTDWNAEPNAPSLKVDVSGDTVELSFYLNPFSYKADEGEVGRVRFSGCSRWRWDATNDHAWFDGKGRFSQHAPQWGEFYEITGSDPTADGLDWEVITPDRLDARHFLFYFRDEAIECIAADWSLTREGQSVPDVSRANVGVLKRLIQRVATRRRHGDGA
jgi:hypothetical protein